MARIIRNMEESIGALFDKSKDLLRNPAFDRFADCILEYQNFITSKDKDRKEKDEIKKRLKAILFFKDLTENNQGEDTGRPLSMEEKVDSHSKNELNKFIDEFFSMADWGRLTKEKIAEKIGDSFIANNYDAKISGRRVSGRDRYTPVNELISFSTYDGVVEINMSPTDLKGTENILREVKNGFKFIAQRLSSDEYYSEVKEIKMTSWLFSEEFKNKIQQLFGSDVDIEDTDEDMKIKASQRLAVLHNVRVMKEFLATGNLPEVKVIKMSKDEFVQKFLL